MKPVSFDGKYNRLALHIMSVVFLSLAGKALFDWSQAAVPETWIAVKGLGYILLTAVLIWQAYRSRLAEQANG